MANTLFSLAKQDLLEGNINLLTDTVMAQLINTDHYLVDIDNAAYLGEIPDAALIGQPVKLTNKSIDKGVFNADDAVFVAVTGDEVDACILYIDSGSKETSRLLFFLDVSTGLPVIPNGADITAKWDDGFSKIFSL